MGEAVAAVWEEIERSESYLVCSMYEEAASSASSILKRILDRGNVLSEEAADANQLRDMEESAAMVFVQSLNGLGRTSETLNELKSLFGTVAAIPIQVLLTGVCFQISKGSCTGVREILEEFLSKWMCVDGGYRVINDAEAGGNHHLDVDEYMEVVEVYALTFLGTIIKDVDLAISWAENAALPEEKRQGLLRRLHSLLSPKTTNASQVSSSPLLQDKPKGSPSTKDPIASEGSPEVLNNTYLLNREKDAKQAVLKLTRQRKQSFWSSSLLNVKFRNTRLIVSNGKIALSLLAFLLYYVLRTKRAAFMRILRRHMLFMKKAVVDLWQLAFSYQVNPLAAVQPLPNTARGG